MKKDDVLDLISIQEQNHKIPETNKNFNGEYIARIYGGSCAPFQLIEKTGKVSKSSIEKYEENGKTFYKILYSNGVSTGRKFNTHGFEIESKNVG